MSPHKQQARAYTLHSSSERVHVTVHRVCPAYVYVTHDGLTEGEIDAALLELAAQIPASCWVIVLPTFSESQGEQKIREEEHELKRGGQQGRVRDVRATGNSRRWYFLDADEPQRRA